MNILESTQHIAVIGAGGKMGRGIALILLQKLAYLEAQAFGTVGEHSLRLTLVDTNRRALENIKIYLREQLQKGAEKSIIALRKNFASTSLVSNREMIDYFVSRAMRSLDYSTSLAGLEEISFCFEAIAEDVDLKISVFKAIRSQNEKAYFFTNTSTIPIGLLNEKAALEGRIIGFHFYNPPTVQKLLEIIPIAHGDFALTGLACSLGKWLGKKIIFSKDVAGFIGNGFMIRDFVAGCHEVQKLMKDYTLADALLMVDTVTSDFLLRPMGIFQLIEYVGFDLVLKIGAIMNAYLPKPIYNEEFVAFLKHVRPFFPHGGEEKKKKEALLGPLPTDVSWKKLSKDPERKEKIVHYLKFLKKEKGVGYEIARKILESTQKIACKLVAEGVAASEGDVDAILENGFYHLYGAQAYEQI